MKPRYINRDWILSTDELIHQMGECDIFKSKSNPPELIIVWGPSEKEACFGGDTYHGNQSTPPQDVADYCQAYLNLLS